MNEGFMAGSVRIVQLWFMQWHKKWFVVFILDGQVDLSHNHKTFAWHDDGTYIVASNAHNKHMHKWLRCWYEIWWSQQVNLVQGTGYRETSINRDTQKMYHPWKSVKNCWRCLQFPFLIGTASMCKYNFENASTKLTQGELPGLTQVFVDGWPSCVLMGKPPY